MKDINYDLVKLLQCKMNNVWRLEKFYCSDAKKATCTSVDSLAKILEDEKRHVDMIRNEIATRVKAGIFD